MNAGRNTLVRLVTYEYESVIGVSQHRCFAHQANYNKDNEASTSSRVKRLWSIAETDRLAALQANYTRNPFNIPLRPFFPQKLARSVDSIKKGFVRTHYKAKVSA